MYFIGLELYFNALKTNVGIALEALKIGLEQTKTQLSFLGSFKSFLASFFIPYYISNSGGPHPQIKQALLVACNGDALSTVVGCQDWQKIYTTSKRNNSTSLIILNGEDLALKKCSHHNVGSSLKHTKVVDDRGSVHCSPINYALPLEGQ